MHFTRHFARPIFPRVRELVPGFTICLAEFQISNINNLERPKVTSFPARLSHKQKVSTLLLFAIGIFSPKTAFIHCFGGFNILFWGWSVRGSVGVVGVDRSVGSPWTWSVVGVRGPEVSVFGLPLFLDVLHDYFSHNNGNRGAHSCSV